MGEGERASSVEGQQGGGGENNDWGKVDREGKNVRERVCGRETGNLEGDKLDYLRDQVHTRPTKIKYTTEIIKMMAVAVLRVSGELGATPSSPSRTFSHKNTIIGDWPLKVTHIIIQRNPLTQQLPYPTKKNSTLPPSWTHTQDHPCTSKWIAIDWERRECVCVGGWFHGCDNSSLQKKFTFASAKSFNRRVIEVIPVFDLIQRLDEKGNVFHPKKLL